MANNTTKSPNEQKQKMNPIALILILIATTLAGLALAYGGTMTVITCQRTQQVNCEIKESLLGLYPVSQQQIANVQSVKYDSETRTSTSSSTTRSGKRKKKRRSRTPTTTRTTTTTYYWLVFVGGNRASVKTSENTSSSWTNQTTTEINNFLDNSTEKTISARYIRWLPMLGGFFFLILPFLAIISRIKNQFGSTISVAGGQENQKGNEALQSKA